MNTIKPPNWPRRVCELDQDDPDNNGYQNEDLIVWMRTAALPNFRKLYRKINQTGTFEKGLPAGNYSLDIVYSELLLVLVVVVQANIDLYNINFIYC